MACSLRFNSSLELIPWAALPAAEQAHVRAAGGIDHPPAIVRPLPGRLATVKLVDFSTAILLECFRTPQQFPGLQTLPSHLRLLLFDGLLECGTGGEYVSGPRAAKLFEAPAPVCDEFSLEALRYAASLPYDDARLIASRLYSFHTIPCTAAWKRALYRDGAVANWLGLNAGGSLAQLFAAHDYDEIEHPQWLAWHRDTTALPFKLYISPRPEALPDTLGAVVEEGIAHGAGSFKAGRTLGNVLRPDKLILYFAEYEPLLAAALSLETRLRRLPAHGVPFTCRLDSRSMLSWGSDPPHRGEFAGWAQGESWRAWIVSRLACAILEARHENQPEPWRFALTKVNADGVDTNRWTPVKTFWR